MNLRKVQCLYGALHFFILFNHDTMLNSIEQHKILNKKFVRLSFVHYLFAVFNKIEHN